MCDNAFAQTAVSKNARLLLGFSCVLVCVFVSECGLLSMSVSSCGYFDVFVLKVEFPSCAGLLGLLDAGVFMWVCVCWFLRVNSNLYIYMSVPSSVCFAVSELKVEFPSWTALSRFCFPLTVTISGQKIYFLIYSLIPKNPPAKPTNDHLDHNALHIREN